MGVRLKGPGGELDVPEEQVERYIAQGYRPVSEREIGQKIEAAAQEARGNERGMLGTVNAGIGSFLSGVTAGGSDVLLSSLMTKEERERYVAEREANKGVSTAANIAGAIAPTIVTGGSSAVASAARLTPAAKIASIGSKIAKTGEGAGAAAKVGKAFVGGAAEGGLQALGEGAAELALSNDPLTAERIGSVLSSKLIYGGVIGGAAGSLAKTAEVGLVKAKGALDEFAEKQASAAAKSSGGQGFEDLAALDSKGLRAARETELGAIETARVPQRQQLADDLSVFRKELKEDKVWLAIAKSEDPEVRMIAKQSLKADRQLDNVLDNPKYLASNPKTALSALQKQEHALEQILAKTDDLKLKFAGDESGARLAALEKVGPALERNRAFQQKISDLTSSPMSDRLKAIDDAKDSLMSGAAVKESLPEQVAKGAVFGGVSSLASMIPGIGPLIAPLVGAKATSFIGEKVFGRLAKASGEAAARTSKAVGVFAEATRKAQPYAPVLATKVLSAVQFGPARSENSPPVTAIKSPGPRGPHKDQLAPLFHARADEVRSQTMPGPDGKAMMRPEARERVAQQLAPIAAVNPVLADQLETIAARKQSFLADKLPRRPAIAGMPIGPDIWKPSDMQMRQWARYAAAVEDPGGVVERLADGTITPEDAEVMREVYPEMYQDITLQIIRELPNLRENLPYQKRIALSIFSGIPVDAAMDPRVLNVLQQGYTSEQGTSGGMTPPKASPAFGNLKAEKTTPGQTRAG